MGTWGELAAASLKFPLSYKVGPGSSVINGVITLHRSYTPVKGVSMGELLVSGRGQPPFPRK